MKAGLLLAAACAVASSAHAAVAADAKAECVAAADQGQVQRDDGKYRQAHDAFVTCSRDVCPNVVARLCAQWLRQLDDSMPTVVLGAKDETGADLTRAQVTIDAEPLTDALDGKPQPVDPGEHTLRFSRPGFAPVQMQVTMRAGEKNRAVVVTLHAGGESALPPQAMRNEPVRPSIFSARNVTVATLAVLGAAAMVGGGYFVALSGNQSSTASGLRSAVPSNNYCTLNPSSSTCARLTSAVDTQYRDMTIGVSMLVGGGVLLAGAAVVWLAWPPSGDNKASVRVSPEVARGSASLGVAGSF